LPPPCKRRRVSGAAWPPARPGALARHLASVKIQRAWRAAAAVKNYTDPFTQEPVPKGARRLLLVEAEGAAYKFDGPNFAAAVLCSGSFEHPIVRRPLLGPEVSRLARASGLGAFGRAVLRLAFDYREPVLKHAATQCSLTSFLEEEASSALGAALERAEFFFGEANLEDDGVKAYTEALDAMVISQPRAVGPLVAVHRSIVAERKHVWNETKSELRDVMDDALHDAEGCLRRAVLRGRPVPRTALGEWMAPTSSLWLD